MQIDGNTYTMIPVNEPELLKLDREGSSFAGVITDIEEKNAKSGGTLYCVTMREAESKRLYVINAGVELRKKLRIGGAGIGNAVTVRYVGEDKNVVTNGHAMKMYDVTVSAERYNV